MSVEECKNIATKFFYWWWNQKGNNTEEGFDKWAETEEGKAILLYAEQQQFKK